MAAQGELRTYLGIAPGVGKTYRMLRDGRAARRQGVDVVVAYWERHGRSGTASQVGRLEVLPTRPVRYRGASFEDLDVAAVLARRPALALVDELAHANLPGAAHAKRWQDVEELLRNGIGVYTTLNVSNLESLGPLVSEITGTPRAEPVPDEFVRAGEVRLVDLAPAALRRRLAQGQVVPEDRRSAALSSYFRFANLAALRELAGLWMEASVADPAATYRAAHAGTDRRRSGAVMVGLDGSSRDEWLIRYAADLAQVSDARLVGVHVQLLDGTLRRDGEPLERDRAQLEGLGARLVEVQASDVADGLTRAARRARAAQLVIGCRGGSRWARWLRGSSVGSVLRAAGDLPVQVVNVGSPADAPPAGRPPPSRSRPWHHRGHGPAPRDDPLRASRP